MNLAPLLAAPPVIQIDAFAALGAFALGALHLAAPKAPIPHRTIGWIWAGLMLAVVVSSFFIHTIRLWGPFSPIHLLSIFTLAMLPLAVWHARQHDVRKPPPRDAGPVCRGAGDRRRFHVPARPHHARGGVRLIASKAPTTGCRAAPASAQ